jgi:hypothetical protein
MRGDLNLHGMRGWTRKKREGTAWSSSCSRNAHDKNVLVRRAQSRINQATLEKEVEDWEEARSEGWSSFCLSWSIQATSPTPVQRHAL